MTETAAPFQANDHNTQAWRVMVAEDDALLRPLLAQRVRERFGAQTLEAADRTAALALAARSPLDVALIDLGLPPAPERPEEGLLLLSQLRQLRPELPVLVMTGQDEAHCALRAIEAGAFDYLPKPVEPDAFDAALRRAIRYAQAWRALAQQGAPPVQVDPQHVRGGLRETSEAAQERLLRQVLHSCGGNVAQAARLLRIERTQLYYYLDKYGLRPPRDA